MASTDMRGFRYALDPLRKRREWLLDAAMARVAALRRQLEDSKEMRQRVEDEAVAQAGLAAQAWQQRGDPGTQTRLLAYLAQLQARKAGVEQEIERLKEQLALAQQDAVRRQQHIETLQRHRTEVLDIYRIEQDRKSTAEADQDWIARRALSPGADQ